MCSTIVPVPNKDIQLIHNSTMLANEGGGCQFSTNNL